MQIVVNGLLTHYETRGKGPLVVLIHGWGDRLETFDSLAAILQKSSTVLRLDLPGFGQTEAPKKVWTLQDYSSFVADFLSKLDLKKPRVIAGHSNGGAVTIVGLSDGRLQADKLVLLASAGIRDRQGVRKKLLKVVAKTGKIATFWLPKRHKLRLQKRFYGTIGSDMLVAPHLKETFKKTVAQDIRAQAESLTIPTLLIYGDQDKATPINGVGDVLHEAIQGSELHVVASADHFVHQVAVEEVAQAIVEFAL